MRLACKPGDYKSDVKPIWCPGCGDYHVLLSFSKAFAELGLPPEQIVVVSGIGCSSRIPAYTNCYGFHGVHGRSLALAAGLKVTRPDLTVVVASGDGDGYSIGGNHFLHACRRNIDMTYVVMDNRVYGMTKGQPSPTTESDWDSRIAPGGPGLRPFDPLQLAIAAGANFVARGFAGDPDGLAELIVEGIRWPGFALVEVLSPCITFRPEQAAWKKMVRPFAAPAAKDPTAATAMVLADDGFSLGVIYRGDVPPVPPAEKASAALADIERQFALGG